MTTVGDYLEEIQMATREILRRKPDFLITSGGLGPTFDDMTILGVSKAVDLPLRVNKEALDQVKSRYRHIFSSRRFALTKFRVKMATFPVGARPLANSAGTAPGMLVQCGSSTVICLPGVPKELRTIFSEHVRPMIRLRSGARGHISKIIHVSRVFESELAPLIDHVMKRESEIYVKSHPQGGEGRSRSEIRLDFSYTGDDLEKGQQAVSRAVAHMKQLLVARTR